MVTVSQRRTHTKGVVPQADSYPVSPSRSERPFPKHELLHGFDLRQWQSRSLNHLWPSSYQGLRWKHECWLAQFRVLRSVSLGAHVPYPAKHVELECHSSLLHGLRCFRGAEMVAAAISRVCLALPSVLSIPRASFYGEGEGRG
jgi:hypothetical protein